MSGNRSGVGRHHAGHRLAVLLAVASTLVPALAGAGANADGRVRLSFSRGTNLAFLDGAPAELLVVYCKVENAPDVAGLGVKLRWNPRATLSCYRQVNPPSTLDCGRVLVDREAGSFGGEPFEHRIVFPEGAPRTTFAFAFRMSGCVDPPPTTFFIESAEARDRFGDYDALHVTGAVHVAGGQLELPTYEIPEYLSFQHHASTLNRYWRRVVGTERLVRRPNRDRSYPGERGAAALRALTDLQGRLGLTGAFGHLAVVGVSLGAPADVVQIRQHVNGVPVLDAGLTLVLAADGSIVRVVNRYIPHANDVSTFASIGADEAVSLARDELGLPPWVEGGPAELCVYPTKDRAFLAWRTSIGRWEMFVDAHVGRVIGVSENLSADGPGRIWMPNPRVALADTTFPNNIGSIIVNRPDTTCTYPAGVYEEITLEGLTEVAPDTFGLVGPRVALTYSNPEWAFTSPGPNPDFRAFRCISNAPPVPHPNSHFAQVMSYYYADRAARYLYDELGVPRHYGWPDVVQFKVNSHAAHFTVSPRGMELGDYPAEDAEIILHEYAHVLHHDQVMGGSVVSTPESRALAEGGIANFMGLNMLAHQPRDGAAPFEFLGAEWGPFNAFGVTGKYILNNTLYPWHWVFPVVGYRTGNIFGNALWDVFDAIEAAPGYGTCPNISPSSFLSNCAARDSLYVRVAYAMRATAMNQSFRAFAEAMLEADHEAGGIHVRSMLDAFDKHGWFFTRYDTTYGVQVQPLLVPADGDSAVRTLALRLHSHTGIKADSVLVHYTAIAEPPVTQSMIYDPGLEAYVAFIDVSAYAPVNHIRYVVSAVNQINGPANPGVTTYWPKNAPADTTTGFYRGTNFEPIRVQSSQPETIPQGVERTLSVPVSAPTSVIYDVNVNIRIEDDGHLIQQARWFIQYENDVASRVTLVRNGLMDQESWPSFLDIWFDDEYDAPYESFAPWDLNSTTYTPSFLSAFDAQGVDGNWKLVVDNTKGAEDIVLSSWGLEFSTEPFPTVGVADQGTPAPQRHSLGQPRPNPFNPTTQFPLRLGAPAQVQFRVYDIAGRFVRELVNEQLQMGSYTINWDGRNGKGLLVSSGVYYYELNAGGRVFKGKAVLVR